MTHHFGAESVLSSHSQSIPPKSFNFSISFSFIPRAGGVSGSSSCTVTAQRSLESVHSASESLSGRTQCATCGRCSARSPHRSRRGRCPSVCSSELKVSAAVLRRDSTRGAERGQTRGTVRGGTGGREQSVFVVRALRAFFLLGHGRRPHSLWALCRCRSRCGECPHGQRERGSVGRVLHFVAGHSRDGVGRVVECRKGVAGGVQRGYGVGQVAECREGTTW